MAAPFKSGDGHWQDFSFPEKIQQVFEKGYLADCVFKVGPEDETAEILYGHKLMFILESPVMETMLTGKFSEAANKSEVRITDFQPKDFKNFRYMIYSNNLSNLSKFSLEEIFELYRLCDKYLVSSIAKHCIDHLIGLLRSTQTLCTLITMYGFACELEDTTLKLAIESKIDMIDIKVDIKLNDLSEIAIYEYIKFISSSNCNRFGRISSLTLFNTINSYFVQNMLVPNQDDTKSEEKFGKVTKEYVDMKIKENETLLCSLLMFVNFNNMTAEEFIKGPGNSQLLDNGRKYEILSNICLSGSSQYNNRRNYI